MSYSKLRKLLSMFWTIFPSTTNCNNFKKTQKVLESILGYCAEWCEHNSFVSRTGSKYTAAHLFVAALCNTISNNIVLMLGFLCFAKLNKHLFFQSLSKSFFIIKYREKLK